MKYQITIQDFVTEKWVKEEIEAEPITLKGFEKFEFVIHEKDGLLKEGFVISELSTGGRVATGATKSACMKNALQNLNGVGVDGFEKMLEETRKKIIQQTV